MTEKEVLQTMETLMSSMSSGDWSSIMPDQFYSLIDSLQEIEGLEQKDIDCLEESYTKYLKLQGTFDYLDDDVELKPELLQPHHGHQQVGCYTPDSRGVSPQQHSPYTSPLPPLQQSPNLLSSGGRLSPANSNPSPVPLMDSNSLDQVLQPGVYNNMIKVEQQKAYVGINPNVINPGMMPELSGSSSSNSSGMNSSVSTYNGNHVVMTQQQPPSYNSISTTQPLPHYNAGGSPQMIPTTMGNANMNRHQNPPPGYPNPNADPEEDEFDWSTIM